MAAKRLHLVRHSHVAERFRGRYLGRADVELSDTGLLQAQQLGQVLRPLLNEPAVWVSPLKRCLQTVKGMGLTTPAQVVPELQEIDFGKWDQLTFNEINAGNAKAVTEWSTYNMAFRFPEGESLGEFVERVSLLHARIRASEEKEIVCVSHGGVIATLICLLLGLHPSQYLTFHIERAAFASLMVFNNGLGRLTALNWGGQGLRANFGEWPA